MSRQQRTSQRPLSGAPQAASRLSLQDKLATRQAKRAAKADERYQKSQALREEGNDLFRNCDYEGAADRYRQAIAVHTSVKPVLWTNLANAYSHLGKFVDAHEAAEKALFADPKSLKARFQRAMARKNMESYTAAAIDLRVVLRLNPKYSRDLRLELAYVEKCARENCFIEEERGDCESEDEFPAPEDGSEFGESLSESSDCEHKGNRRPCRWYNHDGCTKGHVCAYSHAPDVHSERDALGRNVCKYYLMDVCKFGNERCSYSHSKVYLLQKGWWSTPEGVDKAKKVYHVRQKFKDAYIEYEKQNGTLTDSQTRRGAEKKRSKGKKKRSESSQLGVTEVRTGVVTIAGEKRVPQISPRSETTVTYLASCEENDSDYGDDGYGVMGFSEAEAAELWCYGLKPWDNEARDFLDALHEKRRKMDALENEKNEKRKGKLDEQAPQGGSVSGVPPVAGGSQQTGIVSGQVSQKKKSKKKKKCMTNYSAPSCRRYDSDDEFGGMGGFTRSETDDLLTYGVDPFDIDAGEFLHALYSADF